MATRSTISAKIGNVVKSIYCHFDGYPDHNGKILFEHYNTQEKVKALLNLGDLSSLAPSVACPEGHSFEYKIPGYCVAYGRDRGEVNTQAKETPWVEGYEKTYPVEQEFGYYWNGKEWFVNNVSLKQVLKENKII